MAKAKKSYGQHFLTDEHICSTIASYILKLEEVDLIIEVGPGQGALTRHLYNSKKDFIAIEADRDMVFAVHEKLHDLKQGTVILEDFLKVDLEKLIAGRRTALVGNFPYNISSQIVFRVIQHHSSINHMVGMFQKEVSDRIIAPHGSKTYGILSVLAAAFYSGSTVINVPPSSFSPPPRVDSSVIHLSKKDNPPHIPDFAFFKRVVKAAFGMRRKMLRNSLKSVSAKEMDTNSPLFSKRPEQMSLQDFIDITELIRKNGL